MKDKSMKLRGSRNLRMRLLLSTLSLKPITVHDIRSEVTPPGLSPHEISLIRLLDKISDGCVVQIDDTGNWKQPDFFANDSSIFNTVIG